MIACALFNQQNKGPILPSIITWFVLEKQKCTSEKGLFWVFGTCLKFDLFDLTLLFCGQVGKEQSWYEWSYCKDSEWRILGFRDVFFRQQLKFGLFIIKRCFAHKLAKKWTKTRGRVKLIFFLLLFVLLKPKTFFVVVWSRRRHCLIFLIAGFVGRTSKIREPKQTRRRGKRERHLKMWLRVSACSHFFQLFKLIMLEKCVLTILELNWNQRFRLRWQNWTFVIICSRRPHNCKTGHSTS